MEQIPESQVQARIALENPWWNDSITEMSLAVGLKPRAYLDLFEPLVRRTQVRRAVLLMGPRRVGKTVMIHHVIDRLLKSGVPKRDVCYLSVDHPMYNGRGLEELLATYRSVAGIERDMTGSFVFFDEIQYLRSWEVHLKHLVDSYPAARFVASGSAAAALRRRSEESGAGRFTDFLLPPLTFSEFLQLVDRSDLVEVDWLRVTFEGKLPKDQAVHLVAELNELFLDYINFGGYPEVATVPEVRRDPARYIKGDIIDKVLLRDLPSIYGIDDVQELNYLFTTLAYNTANELSVDEISKNSGVAKNTIRRYLEYLEAAFLIKVVHRIDRNGRRFRRANRFKVFLTNPSIRTALFAPITVDDPGMGRMVETAIYAQWFHRREAIHYARWDKGEVDLVVLDAALIPAQAIEVKFTDRVFDRRAELASIIRFVKENEMTGAVVTTASRWSYTRFEQNLIFFVPASVVAILTALQATDPDSNLSLSLVAASEAAAGSGP